MTPSPEAQEPATKSLRSQAAVIRTIDPLDVDFSDLTALASAIGNARLVVLGEGTHSEGTTSQAKARVARFLHAHLGFEVLAWESGLAQVHGMNAQLRDADVSLDEAKSYLMSGGWAHEEAIHPLFEYARASWATESPLEMAAFDLGRPHRGAPYFLQALSDIFQRAPFLAFSEDEWSLARSFARRAFGFRSSALPDPIQREAERALLEGLLEHMDQERVELSTRMSGRAMEIARMFITHALQSEELGQLRGLEWNTARDAYMAEAVLWLRESMYPGKKIMIWAATSHFIRESEKIRNLENEDWYQTPFEAGNRLHGILGDEMYTIAFTSYGGQFGDEFPEGSVHERSVRALVPAPPDSFEAAAHAIGESFVFVDLRGAPDDHWLKGEYTSVALGRLENVAPWEQIVDAFFFIDEARPIRYRSR